MNASFFRSLLVEAFVNRNWAKISDIIDLFTEFILLEEADPYWSDPH